MMTLRFILWQVMQQGLTEQMLCLYSQWTTEKEYLEDPVPGDTKKKEVASKLRQKCAELTQVRQYRCPLGSKSEPPLRHRTGPIVNGTARSMIHALSRADNGGLRPAPHEAEGSSIQWSPVLSSSTCWNSWRQCAKIIFLSLFLLAIFPLTRQFHNSRLKIWKGS